MKVGQTVWFHPWPTPGLRSLDPYPGVVVEALPSGRYNLDVTLPGGHVARVADVAEGQGPGTCRNSGEEKAEIRQKRPGRQPGGRRKSPPKPKPEPRLKPKASVTDKPVPKPTPKPKPIGLEEMAQVVKLDRLKCPMCWKIHNGEGRYCGAVCEARAQRPVY